MAWGYRCALVAMAAVVVGIFTHTSNAQTLSPEREQALKPNDTFKECDVCPEMVAIPAGSFSMGSPPSTSSWGRRENPEHSVTFARSFAVGKFQVTVDQFAAFVKESGYDASSKCYTFDGGKGDERSGRSWRNPGFAQTGSHPATCINWNDAKAYVAWLSRKTGKTYRLLSESEREYVTRAGTTTPFWWGASITTNQANYDGDSYEGGPKGQNRGRTIPINSFQPNPWGLYQVHGNLHEWTEDCENESYNGAPTDGSAWSSGDCGMRVIRGGSWFHWALDLRSAARFRYPSDSRLSFIGIRAARTLAP